jgi:peptidoglycan/xylan/chitin deacetylase (PgdA/CDA1 family)
VPILGEFGAPATFFLTSEAIDRPREYWWDALERCVLVEPSLPSVVALRLNGTPERYDAATPDARSRLHDALYARLRTAGPAVRDDVVRQLNTLTGQHRRSISNRPMTQREIRELAARPGVEIGAHGVHHLAVSALDPESLHREIFECRTTLERVTGCPVRHFAYPFGDVSAEAVATTREADYTAAVSCEPRAVRAHDWLHRLPRLSAPRLEGDAFAEWLCRACALPAWDRTERP